MPHAQPHRRGALAAAVAVLALTSLLPARWGGWANRLGAVADLLVAPVSSPVRSLVGLVRPQPGAQSPEAAALQRELDKWKQLYRQIEGENERLRKRFDEISRNFLPTEIPVNTLLRPVIGGSAEPGGQIKVRAGGKDGVEVNSFATTVGVQLVGRVVQVSPRLCWVRQINDRAAGQISGIVVADDAEPHASSEPRGLLCNLSPVTSGLLQGYVTVSPSQRPPVNGQLVRLDDETWPRSAQAMVIGRIDRVEIMATGHCVVTVKPTVELDRLAEVVIWVSQPNEAGGAP